MNSIKMKLKRILGDKLPATATSFFTSDNQAVFCNRKGFFMFRKLNKNQIQQLKSENLFGSFGWTLN